VFHGVADSVVYDLGDFIDDYATDPVLRNDLGLLFLATFDDRGRLARLEAIPLALDYCSTRLAAREEADWVVDRFRRACIAFGTRVDQRGDRLVIDCEPPETACDEPVGRR
jgi:poly-gamma-glutamate synthesis protein (capsule biosynthesis protein)